MTTTTTPTADLDVAVLTDDTTAADAHHCALHEVCRADATDILRMPATVSIDAVELDTAAEVHLCATHHRLATDVALVARHADLATALQSTASAGSFLVTLRSYADDTGAVRLSDRELARVVRCHPRTIQNRLRALRLAGYITFEHTQDRKRYRTIRVGEPST